MNLFWRFPPDANINGYCDDPFPFDNLATHFSVISTSTVTVAGNDAFILLDFDFFNDGSTINNEDFDLATFSEAIYIFCIGPDNSYPFGVDVAFLNQYSLNSDISYSDYTERRILVNDLSLLLTEKYGESESSYGIPYEYSVSGINDSLLYLEDSALCFYATVTPITYDFAMKRECKENAVYIVYRGRNYTKDNYDLFEALIKQEYNLREEAYRNSVKSKDTSGL